MALGPRWGLVFINKQYSVLFTKLTSMNRWQERSHYWKWWISKLERSLRKRKSILMILLDIARKPKKVENFWSASTRPLWWAQVAKFTLFSNPALLLLLLLYLLSLTCVICRRLSPICLEDSRHCSFSVLLSFLLFTWIVQNQIHSTTGHFQL